MSSGCGVGMAELDMFTKNHDMVDVWRVQHPGLPVFTWHLPDGTGASRLMQSLSPSNPKSHGQQGGGSGNRTQIF
ncbi:hypothetical protein HOLleu_34948 [Holothuria leucospilota]|uniref:Uncharacterized protein n=1 Tax=Holothuria leucospilota TaxID=206669 RepID=A0A9Q0YQT0_HOLLE|nr:hypothetical protein HOLleu_34948 [Holothuria leucospilota]